MSDQKLEQDVVDVLRGIARDTKREGTCTTMYGTHAVWRGVREAGFAESHNIPADVSGCSECAPIRALLGLREEPEP